MVLFHILIPEFSLQRISVFKELTYLGETVNGLGKATLPLARDRGER